MNKKHFLLTMLILLMSTVTLAQRHTDRLDRGLVVIPTGSSGNSNTNLLTWRRLTAEYYDVKYNVYKNGTRVATNLASTAYSVSGSSSDAYQVAAVVNGVEQTKSDSIMAWKQYVYNLVQRCPTGYLDIPLAAVYDRNGNDVTSHYEPNDAEMADLDGDGQLEIIVKRLNTVDAAGIYLESSREFVVLDAYDVNWQTGAATLMWRIDCGPNMASLNSTEINIIAYDWDEDGKAEVVLRGADNMIVYGPDGKKTLYNIGTPDVNTRNKMSSHTDSQYAWTHTGAEYLVYMNGETGALLQQIAYPLPRLESGESSEKSAWGDDYGHRSTKHFLGAPFLDGRKASLFLARGIYTRHKMIAMNLDPKTHKWTERWRWNNNSSGSSWYGNGYHNFIIADVDEDGRDEIVYGSMVIDDNGKGLSTTGLGHGDAQHVSDFDPYRPGLEFFGCNEDNPGMNYRDATTSKLYVRTTASKDDGRGLMGNFSNNYPGSQGRSVSSGLYSSVTDKVIESLTGDSFIQWGDLNFRIYFDGDLCSEILNSPGTAKEAKVEKPGVGRLFTSSGCNMNNDSKNNPCFQGDIIGDWREEIVVRCGGNLRVYTTGIGTSYSFPTLWNDHQYRQAMVWQMMAYNQPPHLSYFLGEMEGITVAPPTLTDEGRKEVANGSTISGTTTDHLMMCETGNMTVSVSDGAAPYILTVNTPSWVQGHDNNNNITTETYTHTLTGGAFTGKMRLIKQGDGILQLPNVVETYSGETNVWAGTLRFDGTMQNSAVWLNRHSTMETNGGVFSKGIKADYGSSIIVGNGGITVSTLELNHGARLVIDIKSDGTPNQVNATTLKINAKTDDVWKNYGPKYLTPVIELRPQGGMMTDGMYDLGTVTTRSGSLSNIVVEGLDGIGYELQHNGNKLQLRVGSGVAVECAEPTIDIAMVGQQPVATIKPVSFDYNGTTVTPTLSAKFNGEDVDLVTMTLYEEDFEGNTNPANYWKNNNEGSGIFSPDYAGSEGQCIVIKSNSDKGDYTPIAADYTGVSSYMMEFDSYFNNASKTTDFAVMSKSHWSSWANNWGYHWKKTNTQTGYQHNAYLLYMIRGESSTSFTVNESQTVTLDNSTWYHFTLQVDVTSGTVNYSISKKGETNVVASGTYTLPSGESAECDGIYIRNGRYNYEPGGAGIDNIHIYRTDSYYYTFNEPGTLEVTTSYPGCKSTKKVCTVATIDEIATTLPESQDNVSYVMVKRSITANQWNTICLPFSMTSQQVKNSFGDQVQLANFTGCDYQNGNITVNFETVDHMEANHPYIIKLPTAISSFNVSGNMSIAPSSTPMTSGTSGRMVGTYVANTTIAKNLLFLSDNMFWYSVGKTKMKALRAWFDFDDVLPSVDGAATRIVLSVDGETTGIDRVIDIAGNGEVYDLQGRKVKRPARQGIYISGGRKIIR